MESVAFFEKKVSLSSKDLNKVGKTKKIDGIILEKLREKLENKCSEHGFVVADSLKLLSRSMGYFEPGRFTGDAVYYVKAEGKVYYPTDGTVVIGEVLRKNKMGLYVTYKKGLKIQVPRDLHLGNDEFDDVEPGDTVEVELKKSLFQVNDPFILVNGIFRRKVAKEGTVSAIAEAASKDAEQEEKEPEDEDEDLEEEEEEEEEEEQEEQELNEPQDEAEAEEDEEEEDAEAESKNEEEED
jgi:DNA-directed RNA polymerase subunit E'/Rpb7